MAEKVNILGFAGSLRRGSFNRALLRAAAELLPEGASIEIFDLEGFPAFNADQEAAPPEKIIEFKRKIRAADALLIATPEYNHSIPGVLKNAIDWASRPYGDNAFEGKPVAAMSAATGMLGGVRAQMHMGQVFAYLDMHPVNKPEIYIAFARDKFDGNGRLTDETSRDLIRQRLENLIDWTRKLKAAESGRKENVPKGPGRRGGAT